MTHGAAASPALSWILRHTGLRPAPVWPLAGWLIAGIRPRVFNPMFSGAARLREP